MFISSRTPKKEMLGTCLRCLWLGMRLSWKFSLFCGLITIPLAAAWNPKYSKRDYTVISDGNKLSAVMRPDGMIQDEKGNVYTI